MTAYTTPERIAAQLGAAFTAAQTERAVVVAEAITSWIDQRTGRSWQHDGVIADELHLIYGDRVFLNAPPVSTVTAVSVHPGVTTGTWSSLDAADFLIFDQARGLLLLPIGYAGQYARVGYTSASAPPEDVMLAADVLAADLLGTTLNPESAGAESISVGQNDISVKYAGASGQQSAGVQAAIASVDAYRRVVLA